MAKAKYDYVAAMYEANHCHILFDKDATRRVLRRLVRDAVMATSDLFGDFTDDSPTQRELDARERERIRRDADRIARELVPGKRGGRR